MVWTRATGGRNRLEEGATRFDSGHAPPLYSLSLMEAPIARIEAPEAIPVAATPVPRVRRCLRVTLLALLFLLLVQIATGFVITFFGPRTYYWRGLEVQVGIQPAMRGETRLIFLPLGEVRARSHRTPLALNIGLTGVSFEEMRRLLASPPPRQALEEEFERMAHHSIQDFARRQIGLGALGALLVPLFLHLRRARYWLLAAAWGALFVAVVFLRTVATFDRTAFASPTYTGSLREAGWIIGLVKDGFNKVEALSDKLRRVADNLNTLYGRINSVPGLAADADTIRLLHISDIHNNPAAVDFVRKLAENFQVHAVIDTGDLTDLGLEVETALSKGLARLDKPYLFVAGNHDSQATVKAVQAENPNAIILRDRPVTVAGLNVLGSPDPSSARAGQGSVDTSPESLQAAAERLAEEYRNARFTPDIVCVHNPRQAEPLIGQARLILCGHMHRAYVETRNGTVICNAGTTGAAGVRYFDRPAGVPFSAAIVTFARHPQPRLLFIDLVVLEGSLGQYSITRHTFNGSPMP